MHLRVTPNEGNLKETFDSMSISFTLFKIIETFEKGQSRVPFVLSRDTKGGVRGTKSRQPIEEERRAANQVSPAQCACTRSRVYGGIKEGAVALVRSLATARRPVANQRRVATVHRPTADYRFSASRY